MSFCGFSEGSAMFDVTPVENMFLLEYLPGAPENFLRVYLYGKMLCIHPELCESLEKMAEVLHMEKDEVLNAFAYWEQQGAVEKLTDNPPSYAYRTLNANAASAQDGMERDYYRYRWYNSAMQELFGAEHLLQPKQYSIANDWLTVLGYEQEAALKLLEYEYNKGRGKDPASVFRRADKRAVEWAERGIHTLEDVEKAIAGDDRVYETARRVLKQLSLRRAPTVDEMNTVKRWIEEWQLTDEEIIAACARTTASRTPSIAYLDAILKPGGTAGEAEFDAVKEVLHELGAIGTLPTPDMCRSYAEQIGRGFERETLLLAAIQCARKGKHSFDDLIWMIDNWDKAGVHTFAEAEKYLEDMNRARSETHEVLKRAGVARRPGAEDINRYLQWRETNSMELILCAAELSNGTRAPVQYMNKLLKNWEEAGITTPEAARTAAPRTQEKPEAPAAHNYQQHHYTEEDFNDEFYYDPNRDFLQEGKKE